MKYQKLTYNKIDMIEVDNELGLKIVLSPVGAAFRSIKFFGEEMLVTPRKNDDYFEKSANFNRTLGPILTNQDTFVIKGKEYKLDKEYVTSKFAFKTNPYLDKTFFSNFYTFEKKKNKDGIPNVVKYYINYTLNPLENEILVDYRVLTDSEAYITISNNFMFCLGSSHSDELRLNKSIVENKEYKNSNPFILENSKYRLEIKFIDYENINVSSNELGVTISPNDEPILIKKKTIYHRQISYKFFKK